MPRIWLLPIVVLTAMLGVTAAGILSRSLILDLVAWWPIWLLLGLFVLLALGRRIGKVRVSGLIPIVVTAAMVVFVVGHLRGWPLNPSASQYLVGPAVGSYAEAELNAETDGRIVIGAGSEFLYEVDHLPGGGDIGIPTAEEQIIENSITVDLTAPEDPGLYRFAGWSISLSNEPAWRLGLGGDLEADLTGLRIERLVASGSGDILLGTPDGGALVTADGAFTVGVPVGTPVRVVGAALAPVSWERLDDGWRAPVGGVGWVITVPAGSVVSLEER